MSSGADEIIGLYERHAEAWDRARPGDLTLEKAWIEHFTRLLPPGGSVLDLGCGAGQPIARHLIVRGFSVLGVDSSPALISKCRSRFPQAEWTVADMRRLSIGRRFDGLIAWDSFFHLAHDEQRRMFSVFREHAAPGAPLLFTTGPGHGEAIGSFEGEALYHASLSPAEYEALLDAHGFTVSKHVAEDPECGRHTVWLAQYQSQNP
ncbi:class I SAM-dependent DNA methyltransferase [Thauera sp. Sel9]|uniref:class I SAM-dependent DNA methyltransferase n=1 Tax=Thauera sp. Sel9 TaxID=2974299 RepID=UPI0021E109F3|nr:class I SAM-dependent methyltransferase [Thauera sp. Sel9]MCV2216714.1 class I SAM-dependent methyltransferase [Thauera sp. Sel9]